MMGFLKRACLQWSPAFWQPAQSCLVSFFIQVSEYLLDHHRVFDAGDDVRPVLAVDLLWHFTLTPGILKASNPGIKFVGDPV